MTTSEKVIKNKPGLLELFQQLGNISRACKIMGYSRDSFYRFKNCTSRVENLPYRRFHGRNL